MEQQKGGVVVGIVSENKIPVKFIGVGETIDDMEVFNSKDFVDWEKDILWNAFGRTGICRDLLYCPADCKISNGEKESLIRHRRICYFGIN